MLIILAPGKNICSDLSQSILVQAICVLYKLTRVTNSPHPNSKVLRLPSTVNLMPAAMGVAVLFLMSWGALGLKIETILPLSTLTGEQDNKSVVAQTLANNASTTRLGRATMTFADFELDRAHHRASELPGGQINVENGAVRSIHEFTRPLTLEAELLKDGCTHWASMSLFELDSSASGHNAGHGEACWYICDYGRNAYPHTQPAGLMPHGTCKDVWTKLKIVLDSGTGAEYWADGTLFRTVNTVNQTTGRVRFFRGGDCNLHVRNIQVSGSGSSSFAPAGTAAASASGDPHMVNLRGERFDVRQRGMHVFIQVPQGAPPQDTLLHVEAYVTGGPSCDFAWIQSLNITGKWAQIKGKPHGVQLHALPWGRKGKGKWYHFGPVRLKIEMIYLPREPDDGKS